MGMTEQRVSEPKDRPIVIIPCEEQREKRLGKKQQSCRDLLYKY